MKKASFILNIVLLLAVTVLFILFFTNKSKQAQISRTESSIESLAPTGSIVYIQMDTLVNQYDMFNDLRSEVEGKFNAIQNDLNKKSRAFENDAKSFQEKMQKGLLTRSQAENVQLELQSRQQSLQEYSQQKQMEMAEEERVMVNLVMNAIKEYLKVYNETKQYSLIITTSIATNVVIDSNPSLNITDEVLNGLNTAYIKNRNR